ncbi:MAG: zinc-binding dehydrogenase [Proteobacteria bacterium]|nr:zinc-binding dehydrogenase [Pseudomonadota bacterium]
MKAAVLFACGEPLRVIDNVQVPALVRGQVHVQLAFSGVCHSQLMEIRGARGPDRYLPHLLGHEGSGRVIAVGEGVTKVAPGDNVVVGWIKGKGLDAPGPKYVAGESALNAGGVTTFNSEAVVSENRCVRLPEGVPLDVAVLFGCAVPTGAGIVLNDIAARPGTTAVVFGLGGIGVIAVMALKVAGCSKIIAVDIEPAKLASAQELGATDTVDARTVDPVAAVRDLTSGLGADYAVDAAGRTQTIEQAFESIRKFGGQCVFASHPASGERISIDPYDLISGKRLQGSWGGGSRPDVDVPRFAALYREGRLPVDRLIGKRYALADINQAVDDLATGRVMRPLIDLSL